MLVSEWLKLHPAVAAAIVWEGSHGRVETYPHWPDTRKAALDREVEAYAAGTPTQLDDPPPNLLQMGEDDYVATRIDPDHAWKLYLSHLACGLSLEIGKKLGWSVTDYPAAALSILYDSREMFGWRHTPTSDETNYEGVDKEGYDFDRLHVGNVIPAPPYNVLPFLHQMGILPKPVLKIAIPGPALSGAVLRRATIERMVDWCRHLVHFGNYEIPGMMKKYWGYPGFSPVMRMLEGTTVAGEKKNFTAGCWGSAGLIRAVLRVINIPAELRTPANHAQSWFPLENVGLCHDDDLYMRRYRFFDSQVNQGDLNFRVWSPPPFPASKLFITSAQFDQLFGPGVSADQRCKNLDWRGLELYLENLPYFLLAMYCTDNEKGTNSVTQFFSNRYSEAELKAAGLWQRLADKLTSVGGCDLYY